MYILHLSAQCPSPNTELVVAKKGVYCSASSSFHTMPCQVYTMSTDFLSPFVKVKLDLSMPGMVTLTQCGTRPGLGRELTQRFT